MASNMFSPKIEIINYFDELINKVDIEIEETLNNYNEHEILGDLKCSEIKERAVTIHNITSLFEKQQNDEKEQRVNQWSETTKVVDYLNQVRMRTIEELRKAQEETLGCYKHTSSRFNYLKKLNEEEKKEELKSELFAEKFSFQVRLTNEEYEQFIFKLFTFVTDFYMSQSDIYILEFFLKDIPKTMEEFYGHIEIFDVFDEKAVLINLILKYFLDNLSNEKYPNNVISVSKRDIVNIKEISYPLVVKRFKLNCSLIDLSKLERLTLSHIGDSKEIELDGLLSLQYLHLSLNSVERFSARNLPALNHLTLESKKLNNSLSTQIFGQLSNIKELEIKGIFSDINMDDLVNLEKLSISGFTIDKNFNFGLFKNVCNHLKELSIFNSAFDQETISKLFYCVNFPNLLKLKMKRVSLKLEKKLFEAFPILKSLIIIDNTYKLKIDNDAFSDLTNLVYLDLRKNYIDRINQGYFSGLINLEILDLSLNRIECIEANTFSNLKNLKKLDLSYNLLSTLNPQSFDGLGNLNYLNLGNNKLTYFHLKHFDCIYNIKKITISTSLTNNDEFLALIKKIKEKRGEKKKRLI